MTMITWTPALSTIKKEMMRMGNPKFATTKMMKYRNMIQASMNKDFKYSKTLSINTMATIKILAKVKWKINKSSSTSILGSIR